MLTMTTYLRAALSQHPFLTLPSVNINETRHSRIAPHYMLHMRWSCVPVALALLLLTSVASGIDMTCPRRPLCSRQFCWSYLATEHDLADLQVRLAIEDDLQHHLQLLRGQDEAVRRIMNALVHKLMNPEESLVLHFAGDQGTGKTFASELISLAWSRRCSSRYLPSCPSGDSLLSIDFTSLRGKKKDELVDYVVATIEAHAKRYPHGIVTLNDVQVLNQQQLEALAPLLGRGDSFDGHAGGQNRLATNKLLMILTTDFGEAGRTTGMNSKRLETLIRDEFRAKLSSRVEATMISVPFLPIAPAVAKEVVEVNLKLAQCAFPSIKTLTYDEEVVDFIVEDRIDHLPQNNAREVARHTRFITSALLNEATRGATAAGVHIHLRVGDDGVKAVTR